MGLRRADPAFAAADTVFRRTVAFLAGALFATAFFFDVGAVFLIEAFASDRFGGELGRFFLAADRASTFLFVVIERCRRVADALRVVAFLAIVTPFLDLCRQR